jgi:hypothetical protein
LAGSCGLKYELDYSSKGAKRATYSNYNDDEGINYTYIIYFVVIAFVLYLLYLSMTSTREGNEGDRYRGGMNIGLLCDFSQISRLQLSGR